MDADEKALRLRNLSSLCKSPVVKYFVNSIQNTSSSDELYELVGKFKRFICSNHMLSPMTANKMGNVYVSPGCLGVIDVYVLTMVFGYCGPNSIVHPGGSRNAYVRSMPSDYGVDALWMLSIEGGEGTKGNAFVYHSSRSGEDYATIAIAERTVPLKGHKLTFQAYIDEQEWKDLSDSYLQITNRNTRANMKSIDVFSYLFMKEV